MIIKTGDYNSRLGTNHLVSSGLDSAVNIFADDHQPTARIETAV